MMMRVAAFLAVLVAAAPASAQFGPPVYVPAAGGGSSCTTPVDAVSDTVAYAFGLRVLRNAYAGKAVNVSLSGTPTDIGFSGCNLDTSLLAGCTTAGACPVNTWYDQSGHGVNCTQTGTARPSLLINQQNGHPTINFASASSQFCHGTLASAVGAGTEAVVFAVADTSTRYGLLDWQARSSSPQNGQAMAETDAAGNMVCYRENAGVQQKSPPTGTGATITTAYTRAWCTLNGTLSQLNIAGTNATSNTTSQAVATDLNDFNIGQTTLFGTPWNGAIAEAILFGPDINSTDAATVSSNQASYWSVP